MLILSSKFAENSSLFGVAVGQPFVGRALEVKIQSPLRSTALGGKRSFLHLFLHRVTR